MGMEQESPKSAKTIDARIGHKISNLRLSKGMTRQKLAEMVGITHQQLQKYEKGVNRIAVSRLIELAAALDTSIDYFFEGISPQVENEIIARQRLCIEVMQDFARIKHPAQQEAVRNLVRSLIRESQDQDKQKVA